MSVCLLNDRVTRRTDDTQVINDVSSDRDTIDAIIIMIM